MTEFQAAFTDGGEIEVDDETAEKRLDEFGADVPAREHENESRVEEEQASEFGVDDRTDTGSRDSGEQGQLFPDVDSDDQVTLTGSRASTQCLWGEDDG